VHQLIRERYVVLEYIPGMPSGGLSPVARRL